MRIFTYRTLVEFYEKHHDVKASVESWYYKTKQEKWENFSEVKQTFNSVDAVGNRRFVFNIKGNDYRIVAIILFKPKHVFIRFIGTYAEYDNIDDCSLL